MGNDGRAEIEQLDRMTKAKNKSLPTKPDSIAQRFTTQSNSLVLAFAWMTLAELSNLAWIGKDRQQKSADGRCRPKANINH